MNILSFSFLGAPVKHRQKHKTRTPRGGTHGKPLQGGGLLANLGKVCDAFSCRFCSVRSEIIYEI